MEHSTEHKNLEHTIIGSDLTTLLIQPGFVEGIIEDHKSFDALTEAFQHIFRNNTEDAILLWNGIPIRLSYVEDLPFIASDLIDALHTILNKEEDTNITLNTANIVCSFRIKRQEEQLTITGDFQSIKGNYEEVLNTLGMIKINVSAFLKEWKLLLEQLAQALQDSACKLRGKTAKQTVTKLEALLAGIPERGTFYQYDKR